MKLRECPFCNKDNIGLLSNEERPEKFWCYCRACDGGGPLKETKEAAIDGWNGVVKDEPITGPKEG